MRFFLAVATCFAPVISVASDLRSHFELEPHSTPLSAPFLFEAAANRSQPDQSALTATPLPATDREIDPTESFTAEVPLPDSRNPTISFS